jgi:hypothetical protein
MVLLVDDNQEWRETVREYLALHGYIVQSAANGSEALELSKRYQTPPELISSRSEHADSRRLGISCREAQRSAARKGSGGGYVGIDWNRSPSPASRGERSFAKTIRATDYASYD